MLFLIGRVMWRSRYERTLSEAKRAARTARLAFEEADKNKFWEGRRIKAVETAQRVHDLVALRGDISC